MDDNYIFGLTLTVIGAGGTLVSLWLLSLIIALVKKAFPYTPEAGK